MSKEVWEGVTVVRKCNSPKEVCQLVGRCDGKINKEFEEMAHINSQV